MRRFILVIVLLMSTKCYAKHLYLEQDYQNYWCNKNHGVTEYKLQDFTRVDCLTDTQAIEFDFANKWAECIGQALYYGLMTEREPACVLILEKGNKDLKYLKRLQKVSNKTEIKVYTIKPENLPLKK